MGYATFLQAQGFVRAGSDSCTPADLRRIVNTIRRHFYNWYSEQQLFADVVETYAVQNFFMPGIGNFSGITLPRECAAVESMWVNGWPVMLRSSWREWQRGISPECECGLQKFDLPGFYSTALDIPHGHNTRLRFVCEDPADAGKKLTIRGTRLGDIPFQRDFALSAEPQLTEESLISIDPQGGVIKDVTAGRVILADEHGGVLGIYEPDESVPSYRRIRITGLSGPACGTVNVRCARQYFPLSGDNDAVETDNEPAWDSMARYLRIYEKSSKDSGDLQIEKSHLGTAKQHILGDRARQMGKGTRSELKIVQPAIMPPGRRLNW